MSSCSSGLRIATGGVAPNARAREALSAASPARPIRSEPVEGYLVLESACPALAEGKGHKGGPPFGLASPFAKATEDKSEAALQAGDPFLETVPYRASRRKAFTPFCTSRIMAAPEPSRSTPRSSLSADADVRSTRHTRVASAPFTWIGHNWWNEAKA